MTYEIFGMIVCWGAIFGFAWLFFPRMILTFVFVSWVSLAHQELFEKIPDFVTVPCIIIGIFGGLILDLFSNFKIIDWLKSKL